VRTDLGPHRLDRGTIHVRTSIAQDNGRTWEKDTKTHQQRKITLDPPTLDFLKLFRARKEALAATLDLRLPDDARIFSRDADGATWPLPDSVSQRYERMCRRLGYDFNIKEIGTTRNSVLLGHELIAAGVDLRTVAGRLGHSGGGVTTFRVYSAFRPEADARAATALSPRLPLLPGVNLTNADATQPGEPPEPTGPYRRIAADLRGAINCEALSPGDPIPTLKALAAKYGVAVGTAHRAVALLASTGHVEVHTGCRTLVLTASER
jgi:integrase